MKITMVLKRPKGKSKKAVHESIALYVNKKLIKKQNKGEIGINNPISKDEIMGWILDFTTKKKYISPADKLRLDYGLFIDRLYNLIMTHYIRKDEITKDTDGELNINEFYYPGLIYLQGIGWVISSSKDEINKYDDERTTCIEGQELHKNQRCQDALNFIKMLPENKKDLIEDEREIA